MSLIFVPQNFHIFKRSTHKYKCQRKKGSETPTSKQAHSLIDFTYVFPTQQQQGKPTILVFQSNRIIWTVKPYIFGYALGYSGGNEMPCFSYSSAFFFFVFVNVFFVLFVFDYVFVFCPSFLFLLLCLY
jgi:hypothetical protein